MVCIWGQHRVITMDTKVEMDMRRILAITWKDDVSKPKSIEEIARYWSLNLQWLNPEEALLAATRFSENGWLKIEGEGYIPAVRIQGTIAPLGWWPKSSLFLGETKNDLAPNEEQGNVFESDDSTNVSKKPISKTNEGEGVIIKRMIRYVSSKSGVDREEIERRAKRKVAALGHITYRMSVILVAKEQGLDVTDLLSLEPPAN